MSKSKKTENQASIDIEALKTETARFCVLGLRPMILHRMSMKAMNELLLPKGKKTAVEKASSLKHNPWQEFRDSAYLDSSANGPTLLQQLSSCFRASIAGAALDTPGAKKTEIGRRIWIGDDRVSIYGIPQIFMSVVRSSDMNRTPDVRTRCIVPEWAAYLEVSYTVPALRYKDIASLLITAGLTQGIGDWRPQKGKGSYGQFTLVSDDDPDFVRVIGAGGRGPQEAAMESPDAYDDETRELLSWYDLEVNRRGFKAVA